MYATPDVGHSQVTAIQGDMGRTLDKIRSIGYSGVELLVRDPRKFDHNHLEAIANDLGLDIPAICTGEVYGEDLVSFADPTSAVRREAIARMKASMELADRFGAMVNVGRLRGRYTEGVEKAQTEEWIREALRICAASYPKVRIVIEPINRHYANLLLTTNETVGFLRELNIHSVGIMLDTVHMLEESEHLLKSMQLAKDYFWHFHISDSERLPPGFGSWDIAAIMSILKDQYGYTGYVTVESFQKPDSNMAITRSYEILKPFFKL
jgi:sugar phosphate isomerase/epimerase